LRVDGTERQYSWCLGDDAMEQLECSSGKNRVDHDGARPRRGFSLVVSHGSGCLVEQVAAIRIECELYCISESPLAYRLQQLWIAGTE
jgi:hypothetical protein